MEQPWIKFSADMAGSSRISKLRDALGLKSRYEAVGLVTCLWLWAAVQAPSGDLDGFSDGDLAEAVYWTKPPKKLREALVASGFVDQADGKLTLHNWDTEQAMYQDAVERSREKTAKRVRDYRNRKKQEQEAQRKRDAEAPEGDAPKDGNRNVTGNVTVTFDGNGGNGPSSRGSGSNISNSVSAVVVQHGTGVTPDGDDGGRDSEECLEGWNELRVMGGEIGQGVLTLTGWQDADLIERLGLDGYGHYCKKLVAWVQKTGAVVDHYREILKWAKEDGALQNGPELLWAGRGGT